MYLTLGFWIALATTVVLMVVSLVSGFGRKRRFHLVTGPLTMVSLTVAVILTEQLVRKYQFPPDELAIHKVCAKTAGLSALPVVVTGVMLARWQAIRPWHRLAVVLFVLASLVATGTGIWVWSLATLRTGA